MPTVSPNWINDGEKYALIGLSIKFEGQLSQAKLASNLWALANTTFDIPAQWQGWLGSIRVEEVQACNLFLLSKLASASPDILDAENQTLQTRVWNFYIGLLLASLAVPAHRPVMLTGTRRAGEVGIRQQSDLDVPTARLFHPYPPLSPDDVRLAAELGEKLIELAVTPISGGHWRFFRTLHIYTEARTTTDILDRLHQYCRCIDGLILPDAGKTTRQFKSRSELFIGPGHHVMMGEIYDVRSAVEHLHENKYLEGPFDRAVRLDLVKKEAMIEHIARTAIARVLGNKALWPHFANTSALATFWSMKEDQRRMIWGDPINVMDALADFDPKYIHDGHLGAT
jgi:hypothetical protein